MKLSIAQYGCIGLTALMLAGVVYVAVLKHSYNTNITDLNNAVALQTQTSEIVRGLYEKATLETKNLEDLLDGRDTQIAALKKELDKKDQDLIAETNMAIKWKSDYQALVAATQTTVPGATPADPSRTKVEFNKDFGPILVQGYTLTAPPEAFVLLHQQRPLKLTLAISQDENKLWHTYVTSSEENMVADISLSGVNPWLGNIHWYERLSITGTVAANGTNNALAGVGAGLDIAQFTVSAMGYLPTGVGLNPMYGLGLTWRPFMR